MRSIGLLYGESEFGCLEYHTEGLEMALNRSGIKTHAFHVDKEGIYSLMQSIKDKDIAHFISFKRMSGGKQSASIQNMFTAPVILALVEFSFHYSKHVDPNFPVVCIDQKDADYLNIIGNKHTIALPLGARPLELPKYKKEIDVVFFGNCIDPKELLKKSKESFSNEVYASINNMIELLLNSPEVSHLEVLYHYLGNYSVNYLKNQPYSLFCTLEYALRSLDRIHLIKNIKEHSVTVYGVPRYKNGWKEIFKGQKNVTVKGAIPYEKTIELMAKSKLVLNSSPHMRYGIHERVFYSLLMGTPCISNQGPLLSESFGEDTGVFTYVNSSKDSIDALIDRALNCSEKALQNGREKVLKEYTWDTWLEKYLRSLPDAYHPKKDCHSVRT
jgi:spore maturation protein CgeB